MFILIVALVLLLILFASVYNKLVAKRIGCENAWSQITVQLKRRHDLIPNLVETVKGYASHEKETLERVIQARNAAAASQSQGAHQTAVAETALTGMLRQVFALSESYPDLKANTNFAQLQEELTTTENKIGFARQHYNDAVTEYHTAIEQIPGNLVAPLGNFPKREFWDVEPEEATAVKVAPKVSFS